MTPSRFLPTDEARRRFGARLDRFALHLTRGDPLADAAVEALSSLESAERHRTIERGLSGERTGLEALDAFCAEARVQPLWFDPVRAARGGALLRRAGILGAVVLAFKSLMTSYASPGGNKPLTFTRRLEADTTRRLGATARFVEAVCLPSGVVLGSPGFLAAIHVRLMHAEVRRGLQASGRWRAEAWGTPINQADMAATVLLFSSVLVDGLETLGFRVKRDEREEVLHLWRGVGRLMGVDDELLCAGAKDASALWSMIQETQGPVDDDGRRLARALLEAPVLEAKTRTERVQARALASLHRTLTRRLVGPELAEALGVGRTPWALALPTVTTAVRLGDAAVRALPLARPLAELAGSRYWRQVVQTLTARSA
jgi:hypothetical protein